MKRQELLKKLGFEVAENKIKRVLVLSDIATEADDPFAIVHHLLTPSENVVGIVAGNFEWRYRVIPQLKDFRFMSVEQSYAEGKKILEMLDIDDVPLLKGANDCITDKANLPVSEGSAFFFAKLELLAQED